MRKDRWKEIEKLIEKQKKGKVIEWGKKGKKKTLRQRTKDGKKNRKRG